MTAYRWVRQGDLPAFKTGGRLRVRQTDLLAFVESRAVDTGRPRDGGGGTDWDVHRSRLYDLLISSDGTGATQLIRKVVSDGAPAGEMYINLLAPALHRVGEEWAAGRLSVAQEHRASEIARSVIGQMADAFRRRGPSKGIAVTVTPPDEQHDIATAMAAQFLRAGGYEVHHLGSNMPIEELTLFLNGIHADVLCVSVTTPIDPSSYIRIAKATIPAHNTIVVFGGQGLDEAAAVAAGCLAVTQLNELTRLSE